MKSVVIFILAFIVATGGSAVAKVMLTKPASAPAGSASDSTDKTKDSTQTDTAIVASEAAVAHPAPDSARTAVAELPKQATPVTTAPADSSKHAATVSAPPPVAVPTPTSIANAPENPQVKALASRVGLAVAANDSATEVSERRVAKVFTSMDPKQAAKVLERMADGDVHIILGYVGPRQAASILAALPPERVAKLSKLAMQGKK